MLAAFPLAFFTAALVTDITYVNTAQIQWANFSVWLIAAGVAMASLAVIAGIVDAIRTRRMRRTHGSSSLHAILTVVMLILAVINGFVHSRDAWTSVFSAGLILSAVTAILVLVTSWIGYSVGRDARASGA